MMKHKLSLLLASLMLANLLSGCGGEAPPSDDTVDTSAPDTSAPEADGKLTEVSDGYYLLDGIYIEDCTPLDEASVKRFADKFTALRKKYFPDSNVWLTTIPDKSDFVKNQLEESLDHAAVVKSLTTALPDWDYIELSDLLTLDDYYATDNHWRQENILPIVKRLGESMGFDFDESAFTSVAAGDAIGAYGYSVENLPAEAFSYLTSAAIESAKIENMQRPELTQVYDLGALKKDFAAYDLFLGGASPIINLKGSGEGSLVIFCDSFASSLTPLLLGSYSKITLIDLRYMMSDLLPQYVRIGDADVLIMYCDRIVNNSLLLK